MAYRDYDESYYDTAQVCINGHVVTSVAGTSAELRKNFCAKGGAETTMACASCDAPIQGHYHVPNVISLGSKYTPPRFCHNCGKRFPWTEAKLAAAQELARELDGLSHEEREMLASSLDDIVADTPRTQLAAGRFKRLVSKAGRSAADGMRELVVDVASEAAKKAIWGA